MVSPGNNPNQGNQKGGKRKGQVGNTQHGG